MEDILDYIKTFSHQVETWDSKFISRGIELGYHDRKAKRLEQSQLNTSLTAMGVNRAMKRRTRWQVELDPENNHSVDATDLQGKSGYFVGIMKRKIGTEDIDVNDMNNINMEGSHFLDCITGKVYSGGQCIEYFDQSVMTAGAVIDILLDKEYGTIQWVVNGMMADDGILSRPALKNQASYFTAVMMKDEIEVMIINP